MPRIQYKEIAFRRPTLTVIAHANIIIREYEQQGFDLTLRQLYYQFVSRDLISNTQQSYNKLGSIINDARLAGLLDWNAITDRTRKVRALGHWDTPSDIVSAVSKTFHVDHWEEQNHCIEVWIEKDALVGVFQDVCREYDVGLFSCRGYVSQSEMWGAAQRLMRQERQGKHAIILHFGDHDPSGIDMTRDIQDRLEMFGSNVIVKRMALTMNQVESYGPPPNPAKITDSRFESYSRIYGDESWELDALSPSTLAQLVSSRLDDYIDTEAWRESHDRQEEGRETLVKISDNYNEVVGFVEAL